MKNRIIFSKEQLDFIQKLIEDRLENGCRIKYFLVRDGWVNLSDTVWWRYELGPEIVNVSDHLENLKNHPEYYQIVQPEFIIKYVD